MTAISKLESHWLFKKEIDLLSRIISANKDIVVELFLLAITYQLENYQQRIAPTKHKEVETKIHLALASINALIVANLNQEDIINKLDKLYRFIVKLDLIYKEEQF